MTRRHGATDSRRDGYRRKGSRHRQAAFLVEVKRQVRESDGEACPADALHHGYYPDSPREAAETEVTFQSFEYCHLILLFVQRLPAPLAEFTSP